MEINSARIAVGRVGNTMTLLHVPSDRFLLVYDHGETIWQWIEQGTQDIVSLIRMHATKHGVADEVAAYEVIVFLDELRAHGFVSFQLPQERDFAPLVDAQTGPADLRGEHLLRLIAGKRPFDSHPLQAIAPLHVPAPTMTLADIKTHADAAQVPQSAAASPGQTPAWFALPRPAARLSLAEIQRLAVGDGHRVDSLRVVHLHGPSPDLTVSEIETVANLGLDQVPPDRRGTIDLLQDPRPDLTIGDLEQVSSNRESLILVIVIVFGPIIIIVVVDGGTGTTRGKTRNGCRTHCV